MIYISKENIHARAQTASSHDVHSSTSNATAATAATAATGGQNFRVPFFTTAVSRTHVTEISEVGVGVCVCVRACVRVCNCVCVLVSV